MGDKLNSEMVTERVGAGASQEGTLGRGSGAGVGAALVKSLCAEHRKAGFGFGPCQIGVGARGRAGRGAHGSEVAGSQGDRP